MRAIGAVSIAFALALAYAISGFAPATQAAQTGQAIFRFDTFGDEQLWTDVLRMHDVISTVDPATALAVGLKVDVEALPPDIIAALQAGQVDVTDPAVTIELLRLNAVVGVTGTVNETGQLTRVGVTCALCHSSLHRRAERPGSARAVPARSSRSRYGSRVCRETNGNSVCDGHQGERGAGRWYRGCPPARHQDRHRER
jgi:hypothetical protein